MIMLCILTLICALVSGLEPSTARTCFKIKEENQNSKKHIFFIAGIFTTYIVSALIFKFAALYIFYKYFHQQGPWNHGFEMLIGSAIIYYSLKEAVLAPSENPEIDVPESLSSAHSFLMGSVSIFNHLPCLLPLFIIIEKIDKQKLETGPALAVLVIYSLLIILPLSIAIQNKDEENSLAKKISDFIEVKGFYFLHYFMLILGIFMMIDSLGFITRSSLMEPI